MGIQDIVVILFLCSLPLTAIIVWLWVRRRVSKELAKLSKRKQERSS